MTSKEIGLEVNVDKTKCMVMSRDQNAGRSQNIRTENRFFERVEEFKSKFCYEEIKSRLNSGNACYYSIQNILSSRPISKNLKIKRYKIIILPVVVYECETWSLTLWEERRLRDFEKSVLRRIFGPRWDGVTGE